MKKKFLAGLAAGLIAFGSFNLVDAAKPIAIQAQGSFAVGGSTVKHSGVFSTKNFLAPESHEGFQNIFLRKGYGVYLIDQPRIGEAGLSTQAAGDANPWAGNPLYADKTLFMLSRVGLYDGDAPNVFDNAAFPKDERT